MEFTFTLDVVSLTVEGERLGTYRGVLRCNELDGSLRPFAMKVRQEGGGRFTFLSLDPIPEERVDQ